MRKAFSAKSDPDKDSATSANFYATLINNNVVLPSATTSYVAVERHFFADLMKEYIESISFDEDWYLLAHSDVREAIRAGDVESAHNHYLRFGYFEHRMPYRILVDESWYLSSYEDVKAAIEESAYTSGQAHFDEVGFAEGRLPHADFKLKSRISERC